MIAIRATVEQAPRAVERIAAGKSSFGSKETSWKETCSAHLAEEGRGAQVHPESGPEGKQQEQKAACAEKDRGAHADTEM